ncbi:hypothetical protein IscW_ISCW017491 [Ixodes scapularis]|uniref:Uncharacterized protein n=1 Tax=Ixodes scapularis TaxID=6945 RepID=B7P8V2_IXOSC|nr:hypothetical protein IscW_ISCW017491 [Ixodes scapularis]|eukprot:XP_002403163.1 hypothetical protein IscW_ISCW017491 [Ixodes scapularis]
MAQANSGPPLKRALNPESASHDKLVLAVCALTCLTGLTVILQALVLSLRAYEAAGKEVTEAPTTDEPVIPIHYDLTMRPFTASGIYEGKVRVMLDAVRDTYSVSLDCGLSLNVTAASIRWNDFPVRVSRTARDGQRLTVQTTHPMVAHQSKHYTS